MRWEKCTLVENWSSNFYSFALFFFFCFESILYEVGKLNKNWNSMEKNWLWKWLKKKMEHDDKIKNTAKMLNE